MRDEETHSRITGLNYFLFIPHPFALIPPKEVAVR